MCNTNCFYTVQHNCPLHTESRPACFTDKQVSACSIQVYHGSMGINAWKTFVLTVEHSYIVRKLEIYGWAYPPCHENPMLPIVAANRSACFSFSAANYFWKLQKKKQGCTTQNHADNFNHASSDCWVHVILSYPLPRLGLLGSWEECRQLGIHIMQSESMLLFVYKQLWNLPLPWIR